MTVSTMLSLLSEGFVTSLLIFALTLLFSMPLGLAVMFGRRSRLTPLRGFIKAYISIMRGTPLMLQLMVVFYGPKLLLGVTVPGNWRFTAVIVAFVINYAAYFAEIYRGGIESIPRGQYEAAQVLGYTKAQTFFKIILPQMVKRVIPAVTNEVITLARTRRSRPSSARWRCSRAPSRSLPRRIRRACWRWWRRVSSTMSSTM